MNGRVERYSQAGGESAGRFKPLALAPVHVPAANPLSSARADKDLLFNGLYAEYAGTSCASPVMAGAAALFLQKHPRAALKEFEAAVRQSARRDDDTGSVPNANCGYGKLDFLELLRR